MSKPSPKRHRLSINGHTHAVYEWGGEAPAVIFFHATGFHGRCWDEVIRLVGDHHCYAPDAAGHGLSETPAQPRTWQQYGADAAEIARILALNAAVGVGHSMGGNALVRAAAALPGAFKSLILVDPVVLRPEFYVGEAYDIENHFVLNRRRVWKSPLEMFNSFKGRGPFVGWQDAVLRDYCDYGLVPEGKVYRLACAPETEAHIYSSTYMKHAADVYDAVASIEAPVTVLRCAMGVAQGPQDLLLSPTAPDLASRFRHGTDVPLPDHTHFIPMQSPELVAQFVRQEIAR